MLKIRAALLAVGCLLFAGGLLTPISVSAQTPFDAACAKGGGESPACQTKGGDDPILGKDGVIVTVTSILAAVAGIVSFISLLWGGVKYITSGGDSSKITSAKQAVIAALIGLVIALLARPIVIFVLTRI